VSPSSRPIKTAFEHAFATRKDIRFSHMTERMVTAGCETRTVPSEYRLDGLKRGESRKHPRITFQATLSGCGVMEQGGRRWKVEPGQAFFAVMPSAHVYYLPEDSPEWTFYWFHFGHPYIVQRIAALARRHPPVFEVNRTSSFLRQNLAMFERICRQRFDDEFDEEEALFEWLFSFERHLHSLAYPHAERQELLEQVREYTLANLSRSFGVEEIAARAGLSRSHYCHQFRDATGLTPAAYVTEVRLAEARTQLRKSQAPLKEIAAAAGFADANHLCKVFRRHYHLSPGAYRGQFKRPA
jgi:AraC-like DNA-binding protein